MPADQPPKTLLASQTLKARTALNRGSARDDPIARAEAVIESMHGQMTQWMSDEVDALGDAFASWREAPFDADRVKELVRRSHDAKGQARTYGYPVIERIAASLNQLLRLRLEAVTEQMSIVEQHVAAIRAAYREQVRDDNHPVADILAQELTRIVSALVATQSGAGSEP